ncbi:hypothetical protein RvY_02665 [Ramazzottius varieornatus]|uniref:Uncharacterized protein n=1 Tax=Ramazzottius varieornatus TaxID=947166 RepID=A0A1D1UPA0_RAMVA|nr:hypothetical protein RvY_02665 [Ramazzottius varieornatus]
MSYHVMSWGIVVCQFVNHNQAVIKLRALSSNEQSTCIYYHGGSFYSIERIPETAAKGHESSHLPEQDTLLERYRNAVVNMKTKGCGSPWGSPVCNKSGRRYRY